MQADLRRLVLLAFLLAGCGDPGGSTAPNGAPAAHAHTAWQPPAPVNVVLIVVDTLRADAILDPAGKYDTPSFDRLAAEGIQFPRAFSAAPMTLPSHMSLFSSRPPFETRVLNNGVNVPASLPLLADWLSAHGYHTRAVLSLGTLNPLHPVESPGRGFDSYDCEYWDIAPAEDTSRRLFTSLAERDAERPLFLFAHFSDPHEPYESHGTESRAVKLLQDGEPLVELVASDMNQWRGSAELTGGRTVFELQSGERTGKFRIRRLECWDGERSLPIEWELGKIMERVSKARFVVDRGDAPPAQCQLNAWVNDVPVDDDARRRRYALEVGYVDHHVGALLAELDRLGLYQDSLIVFTSDHGEALGERKYFGHVEYLTDEQIHVPLIVKLPRDDPRKAELARAANGLATHLDVVPTLLELVGVPALPGQRGTSLLEPHQSVHIAETHQPEAKRNQIALRDERFKMIYFPDEERFELYDLVTDPGELRDVFAERKGERAAWPERLHALHGQSAGQSGAETDEEREAREAMLRALGYGGAEE